MLVLAVKGMRYHVVEWYHVDFWKAVAQVGGEKRVSRAHQEAKDAEKQLDKNRLALCDSLLEEFPRITPDVIMSLIWEYGLDRDVLFDALTAADKGERLSESPGSGPEAVGEGLPTSEALLPRKGAHRIREPF